MNLTDAHDLIPAAWLQDLYNVANHCRSEHSTKQFAIDRAKSHLIGKVPTVLADAVANDVIDEMVGVYVAFI